MGLTGHWVTGIYEDNKLTLYWKSFKPKHPIMSNNLTKRHIVQKIYENSNYNHEDVRSIVQNTLDIMQQALANGQNIELRKFGVFELQVRKSRVGRNPNKPETDVMIPRRAVVKFKAGKEMKEGLDKLNLDKLDRSS